MAAISTRMIRRSSRLADPWTLRSRLATTEVNWSNSCVPGASATGSLAPGSFASGDGGHGAAVGSLAPGDGGQGAAVGSLAPGDGGHAAAVRSWAPGDVGHGAAVGSLAPGEVGHGAALKGASTAGVSRSAGGESGAGKMLSIWARKSSSCWRTLALAFPRFVILAA